MVLICLKASLMFQFTHPGRGATSGSVLSTDSVTVSIHAPREGCDESALHQAQDKAFQFTHPGRGATCVNKTPLLSACGFNSRTPGGVRRGHPSSNGVYDAVSIHAPREGCDLESRVPETMR